MPPAARPTDNVAHPLPPVLMPGPGSPTVLIGFLPAWRGVPAAVAAALQGAKKAADIAIQAAKPRLSPPPEPRALPPPKPPKRPPRPVCWHP